MRRFVSLIFPVLFGFLTLQAAPSFRHITAEDGLSSNHVRSLMQDSYGFIWAGTDMGLNRYDGIDFKGYDFPDAWPGGTVLSMLESDGMIYLGTDRGFFVFDYPSETVRNFEKQTHDGIKMTSEVNDIVKDKDGNVWISTRGQGVFCYNEKTGLLEKFDFPLCEDNVAAVYVDNSNRVWALTNWGSPILSKFNKTTRSFEEFPLHLDGKMLAEGGLVLYEDSRQRFWMGSWDAGLYEIDRGTGHVTLHLQGLDKGINHIHSIIEYAGVLAIGSDDGLVFYDTDTGKTEFHTKGPISYRGLSDRFVYPLLKDREGGLWIGTYYRGLNYLSPFAGQFEGHTHSIYNRNTVGGNVIGRFAEDADHNIWMASDDGGLSVLDVRTGRYRRYSSADSGLSYDNVHALCVDGNDLWIGTYTGGVNVMDMRTGRFRLYVPVQDDETSLDGTSSYSIIKDRDGDIYVATMSGVNLYDRKNDCFRRLFGTGALVIDMDQDEDGHIWCSTLGSGVYRFDPETEKIWTYRASESEGALPGDYVSCAYIDSGNVLWFGTNAGLCTYDPETDSFTRICLDSDFSDICGIVEDNKVFWITTTNGLLRYDPNGDVMVFSTSDGLLSSHFISNSIFKASDGRIYLGTTNGYNSFYPYQIRTNHVAPEIAIMGLTVDNRQVGPGSELLSVSTVVGGGRLELSHQHNAITIQYAALSYCVPEKNRYSYMLEGFDKEWNDVGDYRQATYTNLPAGKYRFVVRGSNNDAVWNTEPAVLDIVVHPHPLLSTSFKILYALIVVLLVGLLICIAVRFNDRKHEKQIEELNDRKEKEVYEAKIQFFTMIAHEIRTPVSLIIGPLENIIKKSQELPEKVKNDLQTIDRNSQRLLYLVNQLLDFRKVEQDLMTMRFVKRPVIGFVHSICERFEPTIVQNGIRFEVDYPIKDFDVCVDSEAMTKLVSNLLTNATKYTKDLVRLSCHVSPDDENMFCITVYDNGCGISKEEQTKIFLPFYQTLENKPGTGIGLSLVKSIAELHGGSVSVDSEPGSHTLFTVVIPINHDKDNPLVSEPVHEEDAVIEDDDLEEILAPEVVEMNPEYKPLVMIVDDNEEIVDFLGDMLSDQYEILTASDGREALEMLEHYPDVAVVISDWIMPGMDGAELCREIRANMGISHISVILLTAKTDDVSKMAGMDCGADAYIEKPFSVEYLKACLKNQIALRMILRQRFSSLPLTTVSTAASSNEDNRFLLKITNLIETHISDSTLTVDFLTEQTGISRSSFYNKIKSLTNGTPNELIQLIRLKKGARYLAEGKHRINEICYMVGFSNPSYFSKCFAKQFGMKPGEFAAKYAEKTRKN